MRRLKTPSQRAAPASEMGWQSSSQPASPLPQGWLWLSSCRSTLETHRWGSLLFAAWIAPLSKESRKLWKEEYHLLPFFPLTGWLILLKVFNQGAVVTDAAQCTSLGFEVLAKQGSSVDAAIAAVLCLGIVHPHTSGIGGWVEQMGHSGRFLRSVAYVHEVVFFRGGVMLVHNIRKNETRVIDFRETAPSSIREDMLTLNLDQKVRSFIEWNYEKRRGCFCLQCFTCTVGFSAWPVGGSTRNAQWDASGPPALRQVQTWLILNTVLPCCNRNLSQSFTTLQFPECSGKMFLLWQQMWPELDLM